MNDTIVMACARHAHEINRAYCGALGDPSQPAWDDAPEWQRNSAIAGAKAVLEGYAATPEDQHQLWMKLKVNDGWQHGPTKDAEAKMHPCIVPYAELPPEQRAKDYLFRAAVGGMAEALRGDGA